MNGKDKMDLPLDALIKSSKKQNIQKAKQASSAKMKIKKANMQGRKVQSKKPQKKKSVSTQKMTTIPQNKQNRILNSPNRFPVQRKMAMQGNNNSFRTNANVVVKRPTPRSRAVRSAPRIQQAALPPAPAKKTFNLKELKNIHISFDNPNAISRAQSNARKSTSARKPTNRPSNPRSRGQRSRALSRDDARLYRGPQTQNSVGETFFSERAEPASPFSRLGRAPSSFDPRSHLTRMDYDAYTYYAEPDSYDSYRAYF